MQRYGTSYYYATLFFSPQIQKTVMQLYKFVRIPDEIVDTISGSNLNTHYAQVKKELTDMHDDIRNALAHHHTTHPTRGEIVELWNQYSIHPSYIDDFFAAMLQDCDTHRYQTYAQLQGYMYGSAEVVGLMMCDILQAPEQTRPQARLLGEAMQYTNFLRDIYEDYIQYGRIYMPTDRLQAHGLTHDDITQFCQTKEINTAFKNFMKEQIAYCRQLYAQANQGVSLLSKDAQLPVLLASKLYEAILDKIQSIHYNVFAHSARTTKQQKAKVIAYQVIAHHTRSIKKIRQTSRFRFRLYLLGPFLLGFTAVISSPTQFLSLSFIGRLLYFTLPANLLIYGVNDIADYDTDKNNPKKQSYESLLTPDRQKTMRWIIAVTNIPFLIRSFFQGQYIISTVLIFRFFGIFYSSKPIRAKAIPFLDGIFNILYIIPGFLGYFLAGGTSISPRVIIAGTLRCMAMHAYSAIPDITADQEAKLHTTATILGKNGTLIYCLACRVMASIIGYSLIGPISILAGAIYILLIAISRKQELFAIYKRFPLINTLVGMILFFSLLLQ